jgi:Fe/S biogenesis protein NfuA
MTEIVQFTDAARERVLAFIAEDPAEGLAVRVSVQNPSPVAPQYEMALIEPDERDAGDLAYTHDGIDVVVDRESAKILEGTKIDWVESLQGSGFRFDNPNLKPLGSQPLEGPVVERVQRVIEEQINPGVATHGGRIALVDIRENIVYVSMGGGCQGCGMAKVTLTQGIKQIIKEAAPEIIDVRDVTDHAAGENPYFS